MRLHLIIDADDTLWESNIYFEQAFEEFVSYLDHSKLRPEEIRTVLDEIEIVNNSALPVVWLRLADSLPVDLVGSEVFRPSPRQADLLIVSGTVTKKMAPQVVRLWNQMPEPKYCIAMGACAISGGPFKQGYNVLKGIDRYIPVDVYIPGCPPTPQALIAGMIKLQEKIDKESLKKVRWYNKEKKDGNYVPMPILGPDLIDVRRNAEIREAVGNAARYGHRHHGLRRLGHLVL